MPASKVSLNSDATPTAGSWWIFLAGLVIFILFQTGLVLEVQLLRVLPPEADDAYCYIYNAIQLSEGFKYNTPALKDFQFQANPEPGDSVDRQNLKWELHHSLFFTHYILHSAFLLVISWISGVSFETAYKITCVLGSLLIAGAISFFLLTITDRISAGLALGSMALTMFPMQGIHYVVPTNICMAVGLILFASVLRNGGKGKWVLFWLSICCIFLHRMGVVYACLGVFTSIILRYKKESLKLILFDLLPTLCLIFVYTLITHVFPLPFFKLSPMAPPPDTIYFKEVWFNLIELFKLFGRWFVAHGVVMWPRPFQNLITNNLFLFLGIQIIGLCLLISPWLIKKSEGEKYRILRWIICFSGVVILLPSLSAFLLIIILLAGSFFPTQEKKSSFYVTFIVFLFILFLSIFHVMYIAEPGHPILRADLTNRLWIPFAVILAAVFARGLWWTFQQIQSVNYDSFFKNILNQELIKKYIKQKYLLAVFLIFIVIGYIPNIVKAYNYRENSKYFMVIRQNVVFDSNQMRWALENSCPQDIFVYDDGFIRHYFLSHGGQQRRAIYSPLLPLPNNFNSSPEAIKYKISWNPYLSIQHYENVRAFEYPLIIPGDSIFKITFDSHFQPGEIQILPGSNTTRAGSSKLRIVRESASGMIKEEDIQFHGISWQVFSLIPERGGSLSLINLEPAKPFFLAGLKFGKHQDHNFLWPWQGVMKVSLFDNQLKIKRSALLPGEEKIKGITYGLVVLQDKGSTVLWRLWPKKEE